MEQINQLKRSTPEQQGVRSQAILNFINELEKTRKQDMSQDYHSFMLLRHGSVIAEGWWEPYRREMPHAMFSLSKSFTSTAIGFAVAEGLLSVEDPVVSYFKKECPKPEGFLAKMRIKHLLSMSTGHVVDTTKFMLYSEDGDWVKAFFKVPVDKEPGTHFLYNTGATYMLSVILQRVTGLKLVDYLRPRFFEPLGISNPVWMECPRGYNTGGYGLSVVTEDVAKLGQLYLNKGVWEGRQLLPGTWVEEATGFHSNNGSDPDSDWTQGYGYQFWRCRHNAYRGDGAFGQYCVVMPEADMVMVITGGLSDMQLPLNILWKEILPEITDAVLPEASDYTRLMEKLNSLKVLMPAGQKQSRLIPMISEKTIRLDKNPDRFETVAFSIEQDRIHMTFGTGEQNQDLVAGIGHWKENYHESKGGRKHVFLTGIWQDEATLLLQRRYVETPYAVQYLFEFKDDQVNMTSKVNVTFGDARWDQELCK